MDGVYGENIYNQIETSNPEETEPVIDENKRAGIEEFYKLETELASLDPETDKEIIIRYKAEFLWEYAKNLEMFLNYTFAEDGTLMSYVLPPTKPNDKICEDKDSGIMKLLTNPIVMIILGVGVFFMIKKPKDDTKITTNTNSS